MDREPADPAERERKIREIRRTGKTWQWPDLYEHRRWDRDHLAMVGWVLLSLACLGFAAWHYFPFW